MKAEEVKALIDSVLEKHTDQAHVSTTLTQLYTNVATIISEAENNKTTAEKMKEDNEKLRQANLDLFLKIGHPSDSATKKETINQETTPKSFDTLFDANGELL